MTLSTPDQIAVLIPCLNEAATIGKVVREFRVAAPDAAVVVIDNGSTDGTARVAAEAGARVLVEPRRGKGRALRTGLSRVDAAVYVLADGDGQVPTDVLPALVAPILAGRADLVIGSRALGGELGAHRLNRLGNRGFSRLLRHALGTRLTDVLSGYRAITRDAIAVIAPAAERFEIEAELTIRAVQAGLRVVEVPIHARARPLGGRSRVRLVRDGLAILAVIAALLLGRPARVLVPPGVVLLGAAAALAMGGEAAPGPCPTLATVGAVIAGALGLGALSAALLLAPLARRLRSAGAAPPSAWRARA